MDILIRNFDKNTSVIINKNIKELRKKGIKINKSEYISQLINAGLTANQFRNDKDQFDKFITELINTLDKNNQDIEQLITILLGVRES